MFRVHCKVLKKPVDLMNPWFFIVKFVMEIIRPVCSINQQYSMSQKIMFVLNESNGEFPVPRLYITRVRFCL